MFRGIKISIILLKNQFGLEMHDSTGALFLDPPMSILNTSQTEASP